MTPSVSAHDTDYHFKSSEVIDPNLTLNYQDPVYTYEEPPIKFEFPWSLNVDDGEYEHELCSPESPTGTHYPHYHGNNFIVPKPLLNYNGKWGLKTVPVTRSQAQNENRSQAASKSSNNNTSGSSRSPKSPLSPISKKVISRRRGSSSSSEESPAKPNNRPKTYKKKIPYHFCEDEICKSKNVVFKNRSELKKHIETKHTKPYVCIFGFANCHQRFGARNEWKRHIATQHLVLYKYICDHSECVEKNKAKTIFNRGDLFIKHQERMHSPPDIYNRSPDDLRLIAWRKEMKDAKNRCETLRPPPQRMTCGFCSVVFEQGDKTWMELIDHVGLHYQSNKDAAEHDYKDDIDLMAWMKQNNLIKAEDDSMDVDSETPNSRKSRKHSYASSSESSNGRQIKQEQMDL
ncbi:hypothetical protein ABW20_dc0100755 [Dactylellina cionopaga]|nr:hypothetical protein ABW20_dc0100755 [Dactylellina cionopaga]